MDLTELTARDLQKECARVLACGEGFGNHDLVRFNKMANHDSQAWYRAVIRWYVDQHGDLPSRIGPGKDVVLLLDSSDESGNLQQ